MGYCSLRVITPPAIEPVSVAEAVAHCRIDNGPPPELPGYITAARAWAENYLNRALITQTLRFTISPSQPPIATYGAVINPIIFIQPLSWWPVTGVPVALPMSPVQSITGLTQRASDGTVTTLDPASDYYADATNDPARITLRGVGQPMGSDLAITYVAGYGDTEDAVPDSIKHAIKILIAWFYEHRGDDDALEPPAVVKMLLRPDRMMSFA